MITSSDVPIEYIEDILNASLWPLYLILISFFTATYWVGAKEKENTPLPKNKKIRNN